VAAVHLVGSYAESLLHDTALELGGEEAIVAAEQKARGNVRPRRHRTFLAERRIRLVAHMMGGLGGDVGRHVVEEQLDRVFALGFVARGRPPFAR